MTVISGNQSKFWHILTTLIFSSVGLVLLLVIYWTITPLKPVLEITNLEAYVIKNSVVLDYDYCKNSSQQGFITRYFKDDVLYYMSNLYSNAEKGCGHAKQAIDIPENLPNDTYTFNFEITYQVNPIKSKTYRFATNKFEVTR